MRRIVTFVTVRRYQQTLATPPRCCAALRRRVPALGTSASRGALMGTLVQQKEGFHALHRAKLMFSIAARTSLDAGRGDKDKASQSRASQSHGRRHASITLRVCNVFCSQVNPFPMPRATEAQRADHRQLW